MKKTNSEYLFWLANCAAMVTCLLLALSLSGCAGNSIDRTNEMIAAANNGRMEALATALAICDEKPGCIGTVSFAFGSGAGQQPFIRPESWIDYIREARMWLDPVGNLIDRLQGGTAGTSGDRAANIVRGDGNVILVGNRSSADNGSTSGFSLSNTYSRTWTGYNREYTNQEPIEGLEGTE